MAITITANSWKKDRPKSAKGSGVAKAAGAVDKACRKAVTAMTEPETVAAASAVEGLKKALKVANTKIKADKKAKDRSKILGLVAGWIGECDDYAKDLIVRRYRIKVEKLTTVYHDSYGVTRDILLAAHTAAKAAATQMASTGAVPAANDIQKWMGAARDANKLSSKQGIVGMSLPEAKQVKVNDVPMPGDVKATKAKVKEVITWCEAFAKAVKRGAKGAGAGLGDVKAIEKELKNILIEYRKVEANMKPVIAKTKTLAQTTKGLADSVKTGIGQPTVDESLFQRLSSSLEQAAKELIQASNDVESINVTWRKNSGPLARQQSDFRQMAGYDAGKHGKILEKVSSSAMLGIRRATLMHGEARKQVERSVRLLDSSTSHRGYAATIPKVA